MQPFIHDLFTELKTVLYYYVDTVALRQ